MDNKTVRPRDPALHNPHILTIKVCITDAVKLKDGTWQLELVGRSLTEMEANTLAALFPHCEAQVSDLLAKEALLEAMVTRP